MRWLPILLLIIVGNVCATTFHGDVQRTGNFTSEKIIPSLLWKTNITGLVDSSPVYYEGYVYVTNWYGWGSWSPGLYCLDASDGSIVWRNENITGASSVTIVNGKVVVGSLSGDLYFVNAFNGTVEKSIKLELSPSWWGIASSPLYYNGSLYITTFSNGTLWKLDENGTVIANFTTGGEISPYTSPSAYDGRIFFAGNNSFYCLDENLNEVWNYSVSGVTNTPSIGYDKVFFATDSRLFALNLDGTEAWSVPFNGSLSTAAIAYGNVYIGSRDGKLYCFNASNGEVEWIFEANGKIDSSPAVANGVVYFATNTPEGTIYAVNAFNGKLMWFYRLKPPEGSYYNIMSSPFLAEDKLYIGADNGYVYCFNSSGLVEINVTLTIGNYTEIVNGNEYLINNTTAIATLHYASSDSIGFEYTLDDSWYEDYGSLLVESIFGLENGYKGNYWMYWVNYPEEPMPSVGANRYELKDGDVVYWYYGPWTSTPKNASVVLKINTKVVEVKINNFTASDGFRGGNITAWVNITTADNGWFVIVVSGLNEEGESLAGISTFYAKAYEEIRVPVLIHVPQKATTGDYKLYAGVYQFEDYPEKILTWSHEVESEVK